MPKCTEAERALIEAVIERGNFYGAEHDRINDALRAVAAERMTPEKKRRLVEIWRAERMLGKERAQIVADFPSSVWHKLVEEIYPRDES